MLIGIGELGEAIVHPSDNETGDMKLVMTAAHTNTN